MKSNVFLLLLLLAFSMLCGCREADMRNLEGTWLELVPDKNVSSRGFHLDRDGSSYSVNLPTCDYQTWKLCRDGIVFSGKIIRDGYSLPFVDTMQIQYLDKESMLLIEHNQLHTYFKSPFEDALK